jgi:hypothetical protein
MSLNYLVPFVLYAVIASPATYKLTRRVAGSWIASAEGLATVPGLLLHALVFVLVVGYLMRLLNPRASGFGDVVTGSTGWGKGHETHRSGLGEALPDLVGAVFPAKI